MTWRASGWRKSWWVDSTGRLTVSDQPILSEWDDEEDDSDPLEILTDKQRFVIELRYGLRDELEYSQRQVADLMGISRSMVNQHEQAAIKKLRKYLRQAPAPRRNHRENPV